MTTLLKKIGDMFSAWLSASPNHGNHRESARLLESGRKLYNHKDFVAAEKKFRKAVLADDRYALAHYYRGLALYRLDQSSDALRSWQRATEVDPDSKAASKAHRRIQHVRHEMVRVVDELETGARNR